MITNHATILFAALFSVVWLFLAFLCAFGITKSRLDKWFARPVLVFSAFGSGFFISAFAQIYFGWI